MTATAQTVLKNERDQTDESLSSERERTDETLAVSAVAAEVLDHERKVTDQHLQEERIQTDIEVERTKAEITTRDELIAIVSHDLRNPMSTIVTAVATMLETEESASFTPRQREIMKLVVRNAENGLRLIRDILDMERIVEGKLELNRQSHDLAKLIQEVCANYDYLAVSKSIRVVTELQPIVASFDRDRIAQVLSNLVSNALKFTPDGGAVTISTKLVDHNSGKLLSISVSDTGPGIPDDQRKKIFGRYTQLGNKDRVGLGLGLYIAKIVVEAHDGRISVSPSSSVVGSTFNFTLPV